MGRYLSIDAAQSASSNGSGTTAIIAGSTVVAGDLLQMKSDGKAYPINDAAAAMVTEPAAAMLPITTFASGSSNSCAGWRPPALVHNNGDIYTAGPTACTIKRYDVTGKAVGAVNVDSLSSLGGGYAQFTMVELGNGNIAVAFTAGSNPYYHYYAVIDQNLNIIQPCTRGPYTANVNAQFGLCALSGGGFACSWSEYNAGSSSFRVFDNSGNPTIADTKWCADVGSYILSSSICQLSNGTLVLVRSGNSGIIKTKYAIYTTAGVQVKAETQLTADSSVGQSFIFSARAGYFCLRAGSVGSDKFYVFDNAGVLQGSAYSPGTVGASTFNSCALLSDGVDFFAITASDAYAGYLSVRIAKIPISGNTQDVVVNTFTMTVNSGNSLSVDAYLAGDIITVFGFIGSNALSQKAFFFQATKTGMLVTQQTTFGSVLPNNSGIVVCAFNPRVAFMCGVAWFDGSASCQLAILKTAATAIIGVAASSANAGDLAQVSTAKGVYAVNALKHADTPVKFDHTPAVPTPATPTTVPGNSGSILANSVILRGI